MGPGVRGCRLDSVPRGWSLFGCSFHEDRPGAAASLCAPSHYPVGCVTLDSPLPSLFPGPIQPLMSAKSWLSPEERDEIGVEAENVPPFLRGLWAGDGTSHTRNVCLVPLLQGRLPHPSIRQDPGAPAFPHSNGRPLHDRPLCRH